MNKYLYFYILSYYLGQRKGIKYYEGRANPGIWFKMKGDEINAFFRNNEEKVDGEKTFWNRIRKGIDNIIEYRKNK